MRLLHLRYTKVADPTEEAAKAVCITDSFQGLFELDYGLGEVDPDSTEGQKFTAVFEQLHNKCK